VDDPSIGGKDMATRDTQKSRKQGEGSSPDVLTLLKEDHQKVERLFETFQKQKDQDSPEEKADLVSEVCTELLVHADLEEELFYPKVRQAISDEELVEEAHVEHEGVRELINQLQEMDPEDKEYNATVKVLSEQVLHHVEEEENEMFPKVRKAKLDLQAMAEEVVERKATLMEEYAAGGQSAR
jgi:hemerythrin superfamily protein